LVIIGNDIRDGSGKMKKNIFGEKPEGFRGFCGVFNQSDLHGCESGGIKKEISRNFESLVLLFFR